MDALIGFIFGISVGVVLGFFLALPLVITMKGDEQVHGD